MYITDTVENLLGLTWSLVEDLKLNFKFILCSILTDSFDFTEILNLNDDVMEHVLFSVI